MLASSVVKKTGNGLNANLSGRVGDGVLMC
jgi:hypothetical protein